MLRVTVFAGCCVRGAFLDRVLGEYLCEGCCVSSDQNSFLIEVSLDPSGLSGCVENQGLKYDSLVSSVMRKGCAR